MKTAVEWLQEVLSLTFEQQMQFEGLFQQAKEMEKQQIIDANVVGINQALYGYRNAKEYYKKTYNKYTL